MLELAAGLAGVTIVTVNPALRAEELVHVLGHSRADGIFLVPEYRGTDMAGMLDAVRGELPLPRGGLVRRLGRLLRGRLAAGAPARGRPRQAAQIQYTSGTTGVPRARCSTTVGSSTTRACTSTASACPRAACSSARCRCSHRRMRAGGARCARRRRHAGPPAVVRPRARVGAFVEAERVALLGGVPTMLIAILDHPRFGAADVSSVRCLLSGGAVVSPALVRRVEAALGAPLSIVFAQTEASSVICPTAPGDAPADRATTLGRALPQTEMKIVDVASGATVAPEVVGELCTRGYHVMAGYFDDPEATAAAIDADGWLHTGDLASMDARGYCRISGA